LRQGASKKVCPHHIDIIIRAQSKYEISKTTKKQDDQKNKTKWDLKKLSDFFAQSEVGARYAKAAFELSLQQGKLEAVTTDLKALKAMITDSADLKRLITDIRYDAADQAKGISAIAAKAGFDPLTLKALGLLIKNGRVATLGGFITAFTRLYDAHKGIVSAVVTSAIALTPEQDKALKAALGTALGREAVVETHVDPSLLGGLKVKLGSRLFDASLKTKLDSLKLTLKRA
jgi:F-type H+-transporting ATPase subunit delta